MKGTVKVGMWKGLRQEPPGTTVTKPKYLGQSRGAQNMRTVAKGGIILNWLKRQTLHELN